MSDLQGKRGELMKAVIPSEVGIATATNRPQFLSILKQRILAGDKVLSPEEGLGLLESLSECMELLEGQRRIVRGYEAQIDTVRFLHDEYTTKHAELSVALSDLFKN
jgi:hypothetical protein